MKYKCPWCSGTTCCLKNMKAHIHELHVMRDHFARWVMKPKEDEI